ncbi:MULTISPECIES: hypothetical protein [Pelotomaculum]|nr:MULTISPECIES: hypothetical protein [Pelotomaculum]OPX92314.1 MAG: hypothetical protein A4E54_00033 [Pelotomaculum sp. PtaB.Bin117]OPY60192.1 MAG: hypothetical protein A4E56_02839 [Pelotomaculum sp. PtaU1.Bin065]
MFQEKMNESKETESKYQLIISTLNDQRRDLEQKITQNKESVNGV